MSVTIISGSSPYDDSSSQSDLNAVVVNGGSMLVLCGSETGKTTAGSDDCPTTTGARGADCASTASSGGANIDVLVVVPAEISADPGVTSEVFGGGTVITSTAHAAGILFILDETLKHVVIDPSHQSVESGGTATIDNGET